MNLLLFIVVVVISFIMVRIGAIAFQLTGLEWSLAKFQSLSCFSGTGFTTKEAELITGNPQYGEPVLAENIKVNPIPKKKALYELDEINYMILYFFSGRINKIMLLEDMGFDEAASIFKEQ